MEINPIWSKPKSIKRIHLLDLTILRVIEMNLQFDVLKSSRMSKKILELKIHLPWNIQQIAN